jgi:formate hydrogenlyase transcriptional activator
MRCFHQEEKVDPIAMPIDASWQLQRGNKAMKSTKCELQKELESRLCFEMTLAEISTGFINMPGDQVSLAIQDTLRRVCECLELDSAMLWQTSENAPEEFVLTHRYRLTEGPPVPERINASDYFPWILRKTLAGETIVLSSCTDIPQEAACDRESFSGFGTKSCLVIPCSAGGGPVFVVVAFSTAREEREWTELQVKQLQLVTQIFANALSREKAHKKLLAAFSEIERLKELLEAENVCLREDINMVSNLSNLLAQSDGMLYVLYRMEQVAATDATVLVLGETGTGKGVIAHAIHSRSLRKERPMLTVNCAALPSNLIESELFGREKGAFTGSYARQMGRFEVADKGTIFLDEIGELPLELQAKLLRIIQDGEFERLGSPHTLKVDVRIIASTSRNLLEEIRNGRFREDLYYRLKVFPITIPPLRQRQDDVPLLVDHFVKKFCRKMGREIKTVSKGLIKTLQAYSWPGNIRELEHVIERAVITTQGPVLSLADKMDGAGTPAIDSEALSIIDVDRAHILKVLDKMGWRIDGKGGAAAILGLNPSTLRSRMQKLGIHRPELNSKQ